MTGARPADTGFLELIFPEVEPSGTFGEFKLHRSADWVVGLAAFSVGTDLDSVTRRAYSRLFGATKGAHLCRIWNFVPEINGPDADGLERYRIFSRARSLEFERAFGPDFRRILPAASAVGSDASELTVAFAAASRKPVHKENPRQVPAYDYPPLHGPRPPSFSRATIVPAGAGSDVFISGTSAVVGHDSVAPGDTPAQLECTLDNLRAIAAECGMGPDFSRGRCRSRHFVVYFRKQEDRAMIEERTRRLFCPQDTVTYTKADICRSELNIEIEASVREAKSP